MTEPLTAIVRDVIEDNPGSTVDEIHELTEGFTRAQVLTAVGYLAQAKRIRCVRSGGKGRVGGSFPGRYYVEVSIREQILAHLEMVSGASVLELADALGGAPIQIQTAITDLCRQDKVHVAGEVPRVTRGRPQCIYKLGRKPGWLPSPLPTNSVFQMGDRAGAMA